MGFECCWYVQRKKEGVQEEIRRSVDLSMTSKDLTCKIIFFWHVILCEERAFEVVHKEESGNGKQTGHQKRPLAKQSTIARIKNLTAPERKVLLRLLLGVCKYN